MGAVESLRAKLEHYLKPLLEEYTKRPLQYRQPKIVRDALWGFNRYEPYELALIDSPPFQRLRNISQTSLAFLTYPCAVHSRFEHSLGAATLASRMLSAIERRHGRLDPVLKIEARLAALLHDLGHGPMSHGSEKFYEGLPDSEGRPILGCPPVITGIVTTEQPTLFSEANASEIITYLMLTTPSFRSLWSSIVTRYKRGLPYLERVDPERMASMILGVDAKVGKDASFYREVVNGPFDADKLDYLPRDGYFTGLAVVVDIERLLETVTVIEDNGTKELGVVLPGASVLEQVLFARTQIYSSVYHHHKVRAAHQMLQLLFRKMRELNFKPAGRDLNDPTSYIALDDYDLLHSKHGDPELDSIVRKIKSRALPKRAQVITHASFDEGDTESQENFDKLEKEGEEGFNTIARAIETDLRLSPGDVVFDLPDPPRLQGAAQAMVQIAPGRNLMLKDIYPAAAWASAYAGYRKVAYVFTAADDPRARRKVGTAARHALARLPRPVKLNKNALALAKL